MQQFSERLKAKREKLSKRENRLVSQADVAERLSALGGYRVTEGLYARWERGQVVTAPTHAHQALIKAWLEED